MNSKNTSERDGAPLTDKLLASIARHLNQDHLEDLLACAKATADWAEQARITNLDAAGITLEVSNSSNAQCLRLNFPTTAKGVLSFKRLLGAMIASSRAQLGWAVIERSGSSQGLALNNRC